MSELEIQELQALQDKINVYARRITQIQRNIALYCDGNQIYDNPKLCPKELFATVRELMLSMYSDDLITMQAERDKLIICTSQTKTSYKPIDILEKE